MQNNHQQINIKLFLSLKEYLKQSQIYKLTYLISS
jgi:hypothetical protein